MEQEYSAAQAQLVALRQAQADWCASPHLNCCAAGSCSFLLLSCMQVCLAGAASSACCASFIHHILVVRQLHGILARV
jgi:hypothetical protein